MEKFGKFIGAGVTVYLLGMFLNYLDPTAPVWAVVMGGIALGLYIMKS